MFENEVYISLQHAAQSAQSDNEKTSMHAKAWIDKFIINSSADIVEGCYNNADLRPYLPKRYIRPTISVLRKFYNKLERES